MSDINFDMLYQMLLQTYKFYIEHPGIKTILNKLKIEILEQPCYFVENNRENGNYNSYGICVLSYSENNKIIKDKIIQNLKNDIETKNIELLLPKKSDNSNINSINNFIIQHINSHNEFMSSKYDLDYHVYNVKELLDFLERNSTQQGGSKTKHDNDDILNYYFNVFLNVIQNKDPPILNIEEKIEHLADENLNTVDDYIENFLDNIKLNKTNYNYFYKILFIKNKQIKKNVGFTNNLSEEDNVIFEEVNKIVKSNTDSNINNLTDNLLCVSKPTSFVNHGESQIYIRINSFTTYYDTANVEIWLNAWYYILDNSNIYFDLNLYSKLSIEKSREDEFKTYMKNVNLNFSRDHKKIIFYYFNDTSKVIKKSDVIKMIHPVFLNEIEVINIYENIKPYEIVRFILIGTNIEGDTNKTFTLNHNVNHSILQATLDTEDEYKKINNEIITKNVNNILHTSIENFEYFDLNYCYSLLTGIINDEYKKYLEEKENLDHLQQHFLKADKCYRICYDDIINGTSQKLNTGDIVLSILHNPLIPPNNVYLNTLTKMIYINFRYIHSDGSILNNSINLLSNDKNLYFVNTKKNIRLQDLLRYNIGGEVKLNSNETMDICDQYNSYIDKKPLTELIENMEQIISENSISTCDKIKALCSILREKINNDKLIMFCNKLIIKCNETYKKIMILYQQFLRNDQVQHINNNDNIKVIISKYIDTQ